jgi:glycosyltransferase involved in cell wall biosynthesis
MKHKLVRITTVPESLDKLLGNQLDYMNNHFDVYAISSDESELNRIFKNSKIKTFSLDLTRKMTPFKDLYCLWRLYKYLKKIKPTIVHTHTPKAGIVGMFAAYLAKVPIKIHTVAGLPLMEKRGGQQLLLKAVETFTYFCADYVWPNSFGLKKIIIDLNLTSNKKLEVIGAGSSNGINLEFFDPNLIDNNQLSTLKRELKISENEFVYLFVGRIVRDKGISELINAFKAILQNNKNVKLLLVGKFEMDLDPIDIETLDEIKTNNNIIHVGYKNDVRKYFAISNCLVLPSYREGFPNVVLQGNAMKVLCIVSDINGCNEIITNFHNGIIIPPKNEIELTNAMELVLKNKELRNKIISNSRVSISLKYNQKEIWINILNEYQNKIKNLKN